MYVRMFMCIKNISYLRLANICPCTPPKCTTFIPLSFHQLPPPPYPPPFFHPSILPPIQLLLFLPQPKSPLLFSFLPSSPLHCSVSSSSPHHFFTVFSFRLLLLSIPYTFPVSLVAIYHLCIFLPSYKLIFSPSFLSLYCPSCRPLVTL